MQQKKEGTKKSQKKAWLLKLKDKWQLDSIRQVIIVLIVFGLTGTTIALSKVYILSAIGMDHSPFIAKLIAGVMAYQVLILVFGTLLGQFNFFWQKEKRLVIRIGKMFKWVVLLPVRIFKPTNSDR